MLLEQRIALNLARMVDLLRKDPAGSDDQKSTLRSLVEFSNQRSITVRLDGETLTVEGISIAPDTPFIPILKAQMKANGVAELRISHRPAAIDLLQCLRVLGANGDASGQAFGQRLQDAQIRTVGFLTAADDEELRTRKSMALSDLFNSAPGVPLSTVPVTPTAPSHAPHPLQGRPSRTLSTADLEAPLDLIVEQVRAAAVSLAQAVRQVRRAPAGSDLSMVLNAVASGVINAAQANRLDEAIEAMTAVVRQEAEAQTDDIRLCYSTALQRMMQREVLQPIAGQLRDQLFGADAMLIMKRAGARGTQLLLDLLVSANTLAERRGYMDALRQIDHGTDIVVSMLNHHEWYVIRNVSDLVGDLGVVEGIPGLGRAAKHEDARVRKSAGVALAKIGTAETVKFLGPLLKDPDVQVRIAVAREIKGQGVAALAMPLVTASLEEETDELRNEYQRALGRIGTPGAVHALINAAKPGGRILNRRGADSRLAAVQALGLAGTDIAIQALDQLSRDSDRQVASQARRALADAQAKRSTS